MRGWTNAEDYDFEEGFAEGTHSESSEHVGEFYHPANLWEYYICKIAAKNPDGEMDESFGWVEVWFFTGEYYTNGKYVPPCAYVSDSEGNFYEVDLSIDGYVISGPSAE